MEKFKVGDKLTPILGGSGIAHFDIKKYDICEVIEFSPHGYFGKPGVKVTYNGELIKNGGGNDFIGIETFRLIELKESNYEIY